MHRQLLLAAMTCLSAASCAKNSAVVASDPFLSPAQDSSKVAVADNVQPKEGRPRQTVSLDDHRIDQANFEQPAQVTPTEPRPTFAPQTGAPADVGVANSSTAIPDKSEWWKAQPAGSPTTTEGIKVPSQSSVNGRVGTVSMSYGMGQISK
jgi:hypothetical protein